MINFRQLSAERCSVRSFSPRKVDEDTLRYVIECAQLAPSAVNFQPWKIYLITPDSDPTVRARLQQCYNREWFATAPYYIICCILHDQSWHRGSDNKDHGDIDIAIFTEHLCLAAAEQGLGTCWVCNFDADLCRQSFSFAPDEEPAVLIPLGYPAEDFVPKEKSRKDLNEIMELI